MIHLARQLHFSKLEVGRPVLATCSVCERIFISIPLPGERCDDVILRLRDEFNSHDCQEPGLCLTGSRSCG